MGTFSLIYLVTEHYISEPSALLDESYELVTDGFLGSA